ncbi:ester cyclase [Hymenobacter koreensis]|uniref:Ester cyclase n=1 Tax=Hymenobacter koreensis TaxID=1084523 RepID=A0ABP8J542_9BACT
MKLLLINVSILLFLIGCNTKKTYPDTNTDKTNLIAKEHAQDSIEGRNKQIALLCIKSWSEGNVDEIVKHLAPNTIEFGDESTPPVQGVDNAKQFMHLWNSSVKDYRSDNELAVAEGDYVFVYAGWSGTFKNDFMGMKTSGKSFKFKDVDIFKFNKNGQIIEHRAVHFSTVLKQLANQR